MKKSLCWFGILLDCSQVRNETKKNMETNKNIWSSVSDFEVNREDDDDRYFYVASYKGREISSGGSAEVALERAKEFVKNNPHTA